MKKTICFVLTILIIVFSFPVAPLAQPASTLAVSDFSDQVSSLVRRYGVVGETDALGIGQVTTSTNRLIVKTHSNLPLTNSCNAIETVEGFFGIHILQFSSEELTRYAYSFFSNLPEVDYVEEDFYYRADIQSSFPESEQGDESYLSWGSKKVGSDKIIPILNNSGITFSDIIVAVIDTGLDYSHPFFSDRTASCGRNYVGLDSVPTDDHGHGTHVAGIIVDNTPSNVKISAYKTIDSDERGYYTTTCSAIIQAVSDGASVINMSLEWDYDEDCDHFFNNAINYATTNGASVVVAAGNNRTDAGSVCPARNQDAITVSATTRFDNPAIYSNYGSCVDVSAPGSFIYSTLPNESYGYKSGTSMASPFVAAAAAILKTLQPDSSPSFIKNQITSTARTPSGWNANYGSGIVNFMSMISARLTTAPKISLTETSAVIAADSEATIYYTTDGNDPTLDSAVYTGPINTSNVRIIKAIACKPGYLPSAVASYRLKWDEDITVRYKGTKKVDFPTGYSVKRIYSGDDEIATLSADGKVIGNKVGDTTAYVEFQKNCRVTYHIHVEYAWWQQLIRYFLFGFLWY